MMINKIRKLCLIMDLKDYSYIHKYKMLTDDLLEKYLVLDKPDSDSLK